MRKRIVNLTAFNLMFLNSCTSKPTDIFPSEIKNRATLEFEYGKKKYTGTAILPRKSYHTFKFKVPEKTRELAIGTCHRNHFSSDVKTKSMFKKLSGDLIQYSYIPVTFLENWDSCFFVASAHTADGKREFALIDFTSNETLESDVYCNGFKTAGTVHLCQAREGTEQMVVFKKPVQVKSLSCELPTTNTGRDRGSRFYFNVQKGYCIYVFYDDKGTNRLTVYGY